LQIVFVISMGIFVLPSIVLIGQLR